MKEFTNQMNASNQCNPATTTIIMYSGYITHLLAHLASTLALVGTARDLVLDRDGEHALKLLPALCRFVEIVCLEGSLGRAIRFRLARAADAARSDFGADDGGGAPMRVLAPPRTPMVRAYPPDIPLISPDVPPHPGRQS